MFVSSAALMRAYGSAQDKDVPADAAARLEAETAALEKQIEMASDKAFYLVLDPTVPDLTLMLRGAELRRYGVQGLSVGSPRVGFVRRRAPAAWQGVVFSGGRLDPPREIDRLQINPPPPNATGDEKVTIPPTPDEAYPVPLRYHIRFNAGPSIEVRPREADTSSRWIRLATWWSARWHDAVSALSPPRDELLRLRLVLAPEDANALYRSLPPDVKLLVKVTAPL